MLYWTYAVRHAPLDPLDAYRKTLAAPALAAAMRQSVAALESSALELTAALDEANAALRAYWLDVHRERLYQRLRVRHIPERLAAWLAQVWPERWLALTQNLDRRG